MLVLSVGPSTQHHNDSPTCEDTNYTLYLIIGHKIEPHEMWNRKKRCEITNIKDAYLKKI